MRCSLRSRAWARADAQSEHGAQRGDVNARAMLYRSCYNVVGSVEHKRYTTGKQHEVLLILSGLRQHCKGGRTARPGSRYLQGSRNKGLSADYNNVAENVMDQDHYVSDYASTGVAGAHEQDPAWGRTENAAARCTDRDGRSRAAGCVQLLENCATHTTVYSGHLDMQGMTKYTSIQLRRTCRKARIQ